MPREVPRPFVKWAGGKRQLLEEISKKLPATYGRYYEPFVGGGALFFAIKPREAVLADSNRRLIRTYRGIKDHVEDVITLLKGYQNTKRFYMKKRAEKIDDASDAEVAAWFVFLNKTGFNGLYRVNSRDQFNVPYGDNAKKTYCDEDNLRACAAALASVSIEHADFEGVVADARAGDLVYFDPPYVPLSATSYFTAYTAAGFGPEDQVRLRDVALRLKQRGVHVILSNSSAGAVSELYARPDFKCIPVSATRLVNSKVTARGKVKELLIV